MRSEVKGSGAIPIFVYFSIKGVVMNCFARPVAFVRTLRSGDSQKRGGDFSEAGDFALNPCLAGAFHVGTGGGVVSEPRIADQASAKISVQ